MNRYLVLAVLAVIAAFVAWSQYVGQNSDPVLADGAPLAQVIIPELQGDAALGKPVFDANCAACHGANAAGQSGIAPSLIHPIYRSGHHGDITFLLAVRNGVRAHHWKYGSMSPVEGVTDAEITLITAYVRALQQENGIN